MRWEGNRQSDNLEDFRGTGGGGSGRGGGFGKLGIGTIVLAAAGYFLFGINPLTTIGVLGGMGGMGDIGGAPTTQVAPKSAPAQDRETRFMATVLADTEDVWNKIFQASGVQYKAPKMAVYERSQRSACGLGQSAIGPFYCPADQKIYIDPEFFQTMQRKMGVKGEFAYAYVIAHEVGHHVQNLMGTTQKMDQLRSRASEKQYNAASVRLELQADCFAGVWAFHANQQRKVIEPGDIEAAMKAAEAIGDDALQKKSQGYAVPESFTHGSSAQRMRWFNVGLESGSVKACDTFRTQSL